MIKRLVAAAVSIACAVAAVAADEVRARVNITSQPSGATVIVDGQDRGTTPITLFDLAPGRHHLKYRLAGYVERNRFFNTSEGPFIEKNEVLVEEKGLLLLKSDPPGCDIQVDGISIGQTPRLITTLAAKDSYSVKLTKAGYQDQVISVKFTGRTPVVRTEKLVLDSGMIDISSEPAGAAVTVNGIERGVTPLTVDGIPKVRAVVKFHLDGFADEVRELAMNAGELQNLPIVLNPLPGTLHLVSVPDGARFYVNDEARGKGPIAIPGLKPGKYVVRAELEGYGTLTREIDLENGQAAREEFRLSNVMGRLEIRTSPAGAQVVLDGRPIGISKSASPDAEFSDVMTVENLMEGEHALVVKKDGFAESVRHPKIRSEKTSQANVRLRRIFIPDVEIVTDRGNYRGVLVSRGAEDVKVEVMLGVIRSFSTSEIRKITFLSEGK